MLRHSAGQTRHIEELDRAAGVVERIKKQLEPPKAEIYLHPDPQFVVVWVRPTGEPHKTNGISCDCTAHQYGVGCRHIGIVRDCGGIEQAIIAAEGKVWNGESGGGYGKHETLGVDREPERDSGVRGGDNPGPGPGRQPGVRDTGDENTTQDANKRELQERVNKMSNYGYDYTPQEADPNKLWLGKDGDSKRMRLVSPPLVFDEMVQYDKNKPPTKKTNFAWIVLYRDKEAKATKCCHFKAGVKVYNSIKTLAESEDWGNPLGYDIVVARYGSGLDTVYTVTPCPNCKPITAEEQALVSAASYDLPAIYAGANGHSAPPIGNAPDDDDDDVFA